MKGIFKSWPRKQDQRNLCNELHPSARASAEGALPLGALNAHQTWPISLFSYKQGAGMCCGRAPHPLQHSSPDVGSTNHCSLIAPVTAVLPDTSQAPHPVGLWYHSATKATQPHTLSHGIIGRFVPHACPSRSGAGQVTTRTPVVSNANMAMQQLWSWLLSQVF